MLAPFPFERFVPAQFALRVARADWEIAGCLALRRAVFCAEQGIFAGDDGDAVDPRATMLAAIGLVAGMADTVVGTVRVHEAEAHEAEAHQAEAGVWFGSRLAVQRDARRLVGLGTGLIRLAVGTARARGCRVFLAHVQQANVALFESLHWRALGPVALHGRPHQLMRADLEHYPPIADGDLAVLRPVPVAPPVALPVAA